MYQSATSNTSISLFFGVAGLTLTTMYFISVFYLCQFIVGVVSSEQHCTKFNYDEQLLEKMVRMEFNVEKMGEQNNNLIEEMKAELESLKADRNGLLDDIRRFKEEIKAEVVLKASGAAPAISIQGKLN